MMEEAAFKIDHRLLRLGRDSSDRQGFRCRGQTREEVHLVANDKLLREALPTSGYGPPVSRTTTSILWPATESPLSFW